ncbi:MAG: BrnT family toxin [Cyanobacteria bacterium P01_G01_bin.54]
MRIESIVCSEYTEEKLGRKHSVTCYEAKQVLLNRPRIRFAEKGHTQGEDVYAAFGRAFEGKYLSVFFIYKLNVKTAIIISARNMSNKERKAYGRK